MDDFIGKLSKAGEGFWLPLTGTDWHSTAKFDSLEQWFDVFDWVDTAELDIEDAIVKAALSEKDCWLELKTQLEKIAKEERCEIYEIEKSALKEKGVIKKFQRYLKKANAAVEGAVNLKFPIP